jgi:hypothetical protein
MKMKLVWTACLTAACLSVTTARLSAAIVYIDATHGAVGNTAVAPSAGGGVFNTSGALNNQGPANDGLWDVRAFGNSNTIYQNASTSAVTDNAQRLVTNATLPAGTYNVFAYFWSDSSSQWRLRAGLADDAGDLPLYVPGDAAVTQFMGGTNDVGSAGVLSSTLTPDPFASPVEIAEGNRRLYQVALGTFTGSNLSVYIDDYGTAQTSFNERTWYDGIGYEVAIPEPASLALLGTCILGLAFRRANYLA